MDPTLPGCPERPPVVPMPLAGLGDGPKTAAAIALREVADTGKVLATGFGTTEDNQPIVSGFGPHGLNIVPPKDRALGNNDFVETKIPKVVPSGSGDNISYSFKLYTPEDHATTPAFSVGIQQITTDPFGNEIFSLKDNAAFSSVKRIESIATQFGEDWDYSILKASVPSVKGGAKDSTLYAELWTDVASAGENDYMVGGWWLLAPNNPAGDYRFGSFARAENSYPRKDIGAVKNAVIGTATYKGNAAGLHASSENGMVSIQRLLGKVTLTADFGTTAAKGSIGGKIDNLTLDGDSVDGSLLLPKVTFHSTIWNIQSPITGATDEQINRTTNVGNIEGINYQGDWLASFQGDPSGAAQPTGIVGVVGGSGGGNSFVASFGAKKVEDEDN